MVLSDHRCKELFAYLGKPVPPVPTDVAAQPGAVVAVQQLMGGRRAGSPPSRQPLRKAPSSPESQGRLDSPRPRALKVPRCRSFRPRIRARSSRLLEVWRPARGW